MYFNALFVLKTQLKVKKMPFSYVPAGPVTG